MYLTRMNLDITKRSTMRALVCPNMLHGAIEQSFSGERKRSLWRIDCLGGEYCVLIQSEDKPDLTDAAKQFGFEKEYPSWETKQYDALLRRVKEGSSWHFRLVANPTKRKGIKEGMTRGVVHAHISDRYQREWLIKQAEKHGFFVKEDAFRVVHTEWYRFRKNSSTGDKVSFLSVAYEGVLRVDVPEKMVLAMQHGIGRGKAYGQGLLTIAKEIK